MHLNFNAEYHSNLSTHQRRFNVMQYRRKARYESTRTDNPQQVRDYEAYIEARRTHKFS